MFTQASQNPPAFENAQDENNHWKNLAISLFKHIEVLDQQIIALTNRLLKRPEPPTTASSAPAIKRHKVDSLDPLDFSNICEDVQNLVWQHFTGNNLLTMLEVSETWNKRVEAGITDKTILNLPDDIQKVRNIKFQRKFKHVSIDLNDTLKIEPLSMLADTAESLKIVIDEKEPINFTKLKSLHLEVNSDVKDFSWISKIRTDQLEDLKITTNCCFKERNDWFNRHDCEKCPFCYRYEEDTPESRHYFLDFFVNLKSLKHLDLSECSTDIFIIMNRNYSEPRWKLESLKCIDPSVIPREALESLKILSMCSMNYYAVRNVFETCNELTTLEVNVYSNSSFTLPLQELFVNKSIKNLSIKFRNDGNKNINSVQLDAGVKILLKAVPELETFFISRLTLDLMRFIAATNMKLQTVKYDEIEEGTLKEY